MFRALAGLLVAAAFLAAGDVEAQTDTGSSADSLQAPPPAASPVPAAGGPSKKSRIWTGGAIGFNFWNDTTRFSIEPIIGYSATPKLSLGGRLRYEYFNDKRGPTDRSSHNYGGSLFSRYRLLPQIFAHAEYAYMSYDFIGGREGVPFLYLGGGYVQNLGPKTWVYAEVVVDVLQDSNSPYEDWDPRVTVGVGVGL
jgi:hypothetical protein